MIRKRQIVVASHEDMTGDRCVDILQDGRHFSWVECRRDPEDSHGWRRLGAPRGTFGDRSTAERDAAQYVAWLSHAPS